MNAAEFRALGLVPPHSRVSVPGTVQSVAALLDPLVKETPQREALVGRHARYTYAELDREVNRAANSLLALGVRAGDRVAGSFANHTEIVVAFYAAMRIGAIWVGVSRVLAPREKAHILADSGARLLIADREMAAQVEGVRADVSGLERIIEGEPGDSDSEWAELLRTSDEERPRAELDPFAPAAIAYTSGTTGLPKGAVHSQHNLLLPGAIGLAKGRTGPEVTQGVCLPLTILNLMILGPIVSAQAGCKCVLMDRIDAVGIAEWVRRERINSFSSVPATFHDLLTHPDVKQEDLVSLTRPGVGGANCPEEFKQLFKERFGFEVQEGYGLTEAPTAVTHTDPERPRIPGSCGQPHPHQEIHILDESDRELPAGEVGEICVAPVTEGVWACVYTPMLGYWNKPEATAQTLRGGMLHTGDMGSVDEEGNVYVVDRRSDLIIRGGANVYPAEVERVLHEDRRVAACSVIGIPDQRLGERVGAAVQLVPGAQVEAQELQDLCAANLARYKVPERVVFVEEFPRNAMNKILKRDLRPLFE